jgi:hypothetical protein
MLRIQFLGAIYHVINRGNFRCDIFLLVGEAKAFLETVREARDPLPRILPPFAGASPP